MATPNLAPEDDVTPYNPPPWYEAATEIVEQPPVFDADPAAGPSPLDYNRTDAGNAEWFVAEFGDVVRFDHARKRWLVWDAHRWRPDADATVKRMALMSVRARRQFALNTLDWAGGYEKDEDETVTRMRQSAKKLLGWCLNSEARTRLESLLALAATMKPVADSGEGWDAMPGLLGVPNGVVDLRTGELRDGQPEDRITMQAGCAYDQSATCTRFKRLLREWLAPDVEDEEAETDALVRFVRRLMGYGITGERQRSTSSSS